MVGCQQTRPRGDFARTGPSSDADSVGRFAPGFRYHALVMAHSTPPATAPRDPELLRLSAADRAAVARGAPVVLPVNPVEYHGPHLTLDNDHVVSVGLARELHARLVAGGWDFPFLLARDLGVGVDPVPGPGSQPVAFGEVRRRVASACDALVALGARRVILMTFHGSPLHAAAIEAGLQRLRTRGVDAVAPFNAVMAETLTVDAARVADVLATVEDAADRDALGRGVAADFHAGFMETSAALHVAPKTVRPIYRELPPCPEVVPRRLLRGLAGLARVAGASSTARELTLAAVAMAWFGLRPFPGYTSRPHLASAKAGAVLAAQVVDGYVAVVQDVFGGRARSPRPIRPWLATLTLGGRLGAPHIPLEAIQRF